MKYEEDSISGGKGQRKMAGEKGGGQDIRRNKDRERTRGKGKGNRTAQRGK